MADDAIIALRRHKLDEILKKWRRVPRDVPRRGWIFDVSEALGMSGGDLAARMKVSQSSITKMERSEARGTIRLTTLRRAARALDCTLVYALVPHESLEHTVEKQRRRIALDDLAAILITKTGDDYRDLVAAYAKTVKRNRLWRGK